MRRPSDRMKASREPLMHRRLPRLFSLCLALLACSAFAQSPPPRLEPLPEAPPPRVGDAADEPRVLIPLRDDDVVEEVRENGRVVMMKVTPKGGPAYYLVDTTGNGNWMRRDSLDDRVRVPMWPVLTFD